MNRRRFLLASTLSPLAAMAATRNPAFADPARLAANTTSGHSFGFSPDGSNFLLDGKPFQIRSGEMHPARIPVRYWRHRIQMAKAMGMNTVSLYVMWNYLEEQPGVFDFTTGRRNFPAFIQVAQEEGMWVLLRPGPYVCGEWDLGGIPPYLLRYPDIALRTSADARYMAAVQRYIQQLAPRVKPLLVANGGPVLMIQVENEYGSFGNDATYMAEIRQAWADGGVNGPFYTEDGLPELEANHTNVPGGAIALSGGDAPSIKQARQAYPSVPAMAGEVYPGWLTHWGDPGFQGTDYDISPALEGMLDAGDSFNIYVIHGGTSFGFWAGANASNDYSNFQPDITSYDYSAPITEQGAQGPRYTTYRSLIGKYLKSSLPAIPAPVPTTVPDPVTPVLHASVWENLPPVLPASETVDPQPFEMYGQTSGFILYRKRLNGYSGGTLDVQYPRDYATVFLGGQYQGGFSRPAIPSSVSSALHVTSSGSPLALQAASKTAPNPLLDILVEGMGHTNFGHAIIDRKGITQSVSLTGAGALTGQLTGWEVYLLPMDGKFIGNLRPEPSDPQRPGLFFTATLNLTSAADTYVDMSAWSKGVVWVNGNNLGRYWEIGPQHRLYCPASFLRPGANQILVFDLHQTEASPVSFASTLG